MSYTKVCLAAASLAFPLLSAGAGVAMPSAATGMRAAVEGIDTVESVQYVLGGRRYCWSNRGWHGPGWYRCGMELSYGYGWGGPPGWHGWREGRGEFRTGRGDFRREGGDFRREGGDFRRDGDTRGRTSSGGGSTRGTSGAGQGEPRAATSGSGGAGVRSGGGGDVNSGASGGVGGAGGAGGGGSPGGGGAPAATPGQRQ